MAPVDTEVTVGNLLVGVGCALLVAGGVMPWAVARGFSTAGIEHVDGTITFAWGLLLAVVVVVRPWSPLTVAVSTFVGFVLSGILVVDVFTPEKFFPTLVLANQSGYGVGVGLLVSLAGALFVLGGGVLGAVGSYYPDVGRRLVLRRGG
jgi:hypothetical protein